MNIKVFYLMALRQLETNIFMKKSAGYLILCILLFGCSTSAQKSQQDQYANVIIPVPVSYDPAGEFFRLSSEISVKADDGLETHLNLLEAALDQLEIGMERITGKAAINLLLFHEKDTLIGEEGYKLSVKSNGIEIIANNEAGIFNGIQTLRQLVQDADGTIAGCEIIDYPRFKWRGLMLDVSRHFFTVDEVKSYIDQMAAYKFNVFHWHLTDDNGWRIEIKSLPKLTEVGAWRVERFGKFGSGRKEPEPEEPTTYGGFYTQDEIKDIVQYAQDRNIRIVPEIDVPGHSMALLAAYPNLSTRQEPKHVNPGTKFAKWYGNGSFEMLIENTLDPGNEEVYETMDKIFTEVAELFPGEYIHLGGDEAYKGYWEKDSDCQALMKKEGLKDMYELQSYFVKRMGKIIKSKGKTMIGWDEILEGGLAEDAVVMNWRGWMGGDVKATNMGHQVVMTPTTYCYLDYTQGDRSIEIPIYASLSLGKAYQFEPVPEGVDPALILGGQGNLWTEAVPTLRHAFHQTYPRAFALSETLWSPKELKNYPNFLERTERHIAFFEDQDKSISKAIFDPIITVSKNEEETVFTCSITHDFEKTTIYYSLDGTFPDAYAKVYSDTFILPDGDITLNVVAYRNGEQFGRMLHISREQLENRAKVMD